MTAAAPAGRDVPGPAGGCGRRERKKRQTRTALIDAALELFRTKGYEATTIDEIVAAVPVSQRTFFRYFATKEDLVIGLQQEKDQAMVRALEGRPAEERPLTALFESVRAVLRMIAESEPADSARFRAVRQVIESNPALTAAHLTRVAAMEHELAAMIARRQGVDPAEDIRPHLIVAFHTAAIRVAFEDCARHGVWDPAAMAARVESTMALAREGLPGWV
ncbi:TetR family transcriptional regulator [Spirillospora sp. NPDC029432]|uniref:TetR family transcriptional regulator n=1 Tax=Spirillospora sp. NPDC029432 TaxID=3154599 RepID=UPI003454FA63